MNELLLKTFDTCRSRQASIARRRPMGIDGIAVNSDAYALEWQRLERIADRCYAKLTRKLLLVKALSDACNDLILEHERRNMVWDREKQCFGPYVNQFDTTAVKAARSVLEDIHKK